jgi:inner membrane protein involved in colicin E2 resistance
MTKPVELSIASGLPPVRYVITGVPQASAYIFVVGKLSEYVGFTKASDSE